MRTYEQTHPWISFRWEPRKMPHPVWLLLGENAALIERLKEAALPKEVAAQIGRNAFVKGALANAALDGNTLTFDQADRCLGGDLRLPVSQQFLSLELENLFKAYRWTDDRVRTKDHRVSAWSLQLINAQVTKGLPWDSEAAPGEFRSVRSGSAGEGVAAEDIGYLVERLCEWLAWPLFEPEHEEEQLAFGLVRAWLAHLYLLWIKPFSEGNGRLARLIEYHLLLEAGVPPEAAHTLGVGVNATRPEYTRQLSQSMKGAGDPVPFIAYLARCLNDGLKELWAQISAEQHAAIFQQHLGSVLAPAGQESGKRQMQLLLDLRQAQAPVSPGRITGLSAKLAQYYARLNPKTLQRDLAWLQEQGFVKRGPEGVQATDPSLRAFKR